MTFWQFIFSKHFLKQLLVAASLSIVIIWVSLKVLDLYTLHGRSITVPDLDGYLAGDAKAILNEKSLRHVINDSIFDNTREPGSIVMQDPHPGSEVKRNRTIYLTTVAVLPEMVPMPDLTDLSRRQAMSLLETHGLTVGRIEFRPDIARNVVLEQKYQDGLIKPGAPIAKGTVIDLVLGEGLGDNVAYVPLVIGMTPEDASRTLISASLNVGAEVFIGDTTPNPKVYNQEPDPINQDVYLQAGSTVNLFYRSADDFDFEAYVEELLSVRLPYIIGKSPDEVRLLLESQHLIVGTETFEQGATRENAIAARQEPEFSEGKTISRGSTVNVWYEPLEEIQNDNN